MKRTFIIGEEWLFYKLYCGVYTANEFLTRDLFDLTKKWQSDGILDQWFFIRYYDPDFHLRIRFRVREERFLPVIIDTLKAVLIPYLDNRRIWKIQLDTYQREIERYGSETMEEAENLFWQDSILIVKALQMIPDNLDYLFSIVQIIENYFSLFRYSLEDRTKVSASMLDFYKKEFEVDKILLKQLNKKYKTIGSRLEHFLSPEIDTFIQKKWDERDSKSQSHVSNIIEKLQASKVELTLDQFITSLFHMLVNRAFVENQRFYELLIYYLLTRYYKKQLHGNIR